MAAVGEDILFFRVCMQIDKHLYSFLILQNMFFNVEYFLCFL